MGSARGLLGDRKPALGLGAVSLLLMGFVGYIDESDGAGCRYAGVDSRMQTVTLNGFTDTLTSVTVCAYQQRKDGILSVRDCENPSSTGTFTDGCGVVWYPFTLSFPLIGSDTYWGRANGPEFTKVYFMSNLGSLHTATHDFDDGPSDATTCLRSRHAENGAIAPITYFNGTIPADYVCHEGEDSFAGCPFACSLTTGCDSQYGVTRNEFYNASHRTNSSSQDTSKTRFDAYGANAASGVPAGTWDYLDESGTCVGGVNNGLLCDNESYCTGGYCSNYYILMRRNALTGDALNVRRGENRRNSLTKAWVKNKYVTSSHQEIGITSRFYDADNYFVFMVREYGGDAAWIHKFVGGAFSVVAVTYPSVSINNTWAQLGFEVRDNGSYNSSNKFIPNGTCVAKGYLNGAVVVSTSSTDCSFAPTGRYGTYSYYNSSAQFWDLLAFACDSGGFCRQ